MLELLTGMAPQTPSLVGYLGDSPESMPPTPIRTLERIPEETLSSVTQADEAPDCEKPLTEEEDARRVLASQVFFILLHLASDTFVSASDHLVNAINKSAGTADCGWTLALVVRHIRRAASAHPEKAELLARLCLRVAEQLSSDVCDEDIRDGEGEPLSGSRLFRVRLLQSCCFGFDLRLAALGLVDDRLGEDAGQPEATVCATTEAARRKSVEEAKTQGPALVRFIGELVKIRLFPLRAVHKCIQDLLGVLEPLNAGAVADACVLFTAVGHIIDTPQAHAHMGIYISRFESMAKNPNCPWRLKCMLKEIVELRAQGWVSRGEKAILSRGGAFSRSPRTVYMKSYNYFSELHNQDSESSMNWRRREQPMDEQPPSVSEGRRLWANSRLRRAEDPTSIS
ncbi:hypothetical protein VTO73DRAFT_11559 [Trametes versicolor]